MKRFHVHVGVKNLDKSVTFYSTLFGQNPTKLKPDYAKWQIDDPRINFAISTRVSKEGVDHLGIQVDENDELVDLKTRLENAEISLFAQGETECCYARSSKAWAKDPSGIAWETYHTMEDVEIFSKADKTEKCSVPLGKKASCC